MSVDDRMIKTAVIPGTPGPSPDPAADRRVPLFVEELTGTLSVHAQYVLYGNIHDLHLVRRSGGDRHHELVTVLWNSLRAQGYQALVRYDQIAGFSVAAPRGPERDTVQHLLTESGPAALPRAGRGPRPAQLLDVVPQLEELVEGWARRRTAAPPGGREAEPLRVALLIEHAGRLPADPSRLTEAERDFVLACIKLADSAVPLAPSPAVALTLPDHHTPPDRKSVV